ncbi:hypothetical protein ACG04Q_11910 [Roseateles sp. DXS20W]|uniref:Helix-turn-helix domain-containing protein n=1 Tax=Pelomonas lactea TaxID=3299030 RepID=A0ABW7GJY9_9BURK
MTTLRDYSTQHGQRAAAARLGMSAATVNKVLKGTYMADTKHIEQRVRERLSDTWLGALRAECDRTSQTAAASRLGISDTTVSQVLSGNYKASTVRIERRVRGELLGEQCECPVMGDVSLRVCQDVQERSLGKGSPGIGNPQHALAWHACRGSGRFASRGACPHFNGGRKGASEAA